MLDATQLTDLVEREIKNAVAQQVQQAVSQTQWIEDLEQQIIQFVQDRITARFSSISTVPDLVSTVQQRVSELFANGLIPELSSYVDLDHIEKTIDRAVQSFIPSVIDNLILDPQWQKKIDDLIAQLVMNRVSSRLGQIDIDSAVAKQLEVSMDKWQAILKKDFSSQGIHDRANDVELTVLPETVRVQNNLEINKSLIVKDSVSVRDLVVTGSVNTDNNSWNELAEVIADRTLCSLNSTWSQNLVKSVLDLAIKQGIDFQQVLIGGKPIVTDDCLSPAVTKTSITQLGSLESLMVRGESNFNETLNVSRKRVGINTDAPDSALSIWDEEINLSLGKLKSNTAWIGTSRLQDLAIGVNGIASIMVNKEGLVTVKELRLGRHRISHADQVPGWSGTNGDLVINSDPKSEAPFGWICLGTFRWQPLRSA